MGAGVRRAAGVQQALGRAGQQASSRRWGARAGRWAHRAGGIRGAAASGVRTEACEARSERSGHGRQARARQQARGLGAGRAA